MSGRPVEDRERRDTPRSLRRDLALLWIDSRSAGATMKRRPDAEVLAAPADTPAIIGRIEGELHGEARRYSSALWACLGVGLMPFALAALGWSGMYWLPVRIVWYPFERGLYGLPWLSLYEWLAYLFLAAFFAYGFALISESRASTRRLSADYYRLVDADPSARQRFAAEVVSAGRARTELVMRGSSEFAEYPPLLDAVRTPPGTAEQDAG